MDYFKYAFSPYQLFSSLISGVPILFCLFLLFTPAAELQAYNLGKVKDLFSISTLLLFIASTIVGGSISGLTFGYFKILCKIFRKDYKFLEKKLLQNFDTIDVLVGKEEFLNMNYDDRLSYIVKQHIGPTPYPAANFRLLPYIRQFGGPLMNQIESYVAFHIMYRNLSFGFLLVAFISIGLLFYWKSAGYIYISIAIIALPLSMLSFLRSVVLRQWWVREGLNGFFSLKIKDYLGDLPRFRNDPNLKQ